MSEHPATHFCRIHGLLMVFALSAHHEGARPLMRGNNYVCRWCANGEAWNVPRKNGFRHSWKQRHLQRRKQ